MAIQKYRHLIKPLAIGATNWEEVPDAQAMGPGNANREIRLNGRDHLEGLNLNFSWGVHTGLGDWHNGMDPHVHPYPECLLFVGLDTANINYLGAAIDCCLGTEQEAYAFNEPTAIVIPAGLPHGPITTKRMYSPKGFGFWAIELNSVSEVTWFGEGSSSNPTQATGKYAHLVKSLKSNLLIERGKMKTGERPGPGSADHLVWMRGKDLEGLDSNIFWGFHSRPGIWRRGSSAHFHPSDEVLVYLGTDPDKIDYLGAEIEIDMGEEHEKHIISKPSVIINPAGTPYAPQVTRWVDKPFAFFAINLSSEMETKSFD
jgi:hypothetical protein